MFAETILIYHSIKHIRKNSEPNFDEVIMHETLKFTVWQFIGIDTINCDNAAKVAYH